MFNYNDDASYREHVNELRDLGGEYDEDEDDEEYTPSPPTEITIKQ